MNQALLRISFRIGAVANGVAAIGMFFPKFGSVLFGITDFSPSPEYSFAIGMGGALMLGWTALLLWGNQEPEQRKGILLLTVFPVVVGLVIAEINAVNSGLISLPSMIPLWVVQGSISILFIYSYWKAR